jgi:carbonic anhydrase/acetyltransferase-like protein (isoleucine patch superfamily)
MTATGEPLLVSYDGNSPDVAATAWIAPNVTLIGRVTIEDRASVWYGAVLRGDGDHIHLGADSNLQDGVVVHADPGKPVTVGRSVTVGHRVVLHGCTIEDEVLIGMAAVVMNQAHIGTGSLVAAGAVVLEGTVVPPGSLVAGVPAKVRRQLSEEEVARVRSAAGGYVQRAQQYAAEAAASDS